MKRLLLLTPLILWTTADAQVSGTWIRTSVGAPTVCPSRTLTINVSNGDLYSPDGAGGYTKSRFAETSGKES